MAIIKTKVMLDKKDHYRALLSDTLPFDNPIIFSNDGLYMNVKKEESIDTKKFNPITSFYSKIVNPLKDKTEENSLSRKKKQSSPYKYKIIKDSYNYRVLSLVHPRSQLNYCDFYRKYSPVIIYNSSKSKFSIRKPVKVSSSFYIEPKEYNSKYKEQDIDMKKNEIYKKYSSSYYSYNSYNRLYKFYNSLKFYELEKKYSTMWALDVSHCFDSIYTHSISWAIKEKEYIRSHIENLGQFPQELDTLMQRSNNNETNGIPIGSEFSRIFAELIFQRIDLDIEDKITKRYQWKHEIDYTLLRYVDDYLLFTHSEDQALSIAKTIGVHLKNYNLHLNNQKLVKLQRPFCSKKTSMITRINELLQSLQDEIIPNDGEHIKLNNIKIKSEKYKTFINKSKSICTENNAGYNDISSYIISSLSSLSEKIIDNHTIEKIDNSIDPNLIKNIKNSLFLLTDLIIFYYTVYPNVSSSYKTAKIIILIDEYLGKTNVNYQNIFRTKITNSVENLYIPTGNNDTIKNENIQIEKLNFILSTTFFGDNYLIGVKAFESMIDHEELDYYTIISCLFYFRSRHVYQKTKNTLEIRIKNKLTKDVNLLQSSEQAHLFLDIMSCPFVTKKTRREIYKKYLKNDCKGVFRTHDEIEKDLDSLLNTYWFVNWHSHDLLTMIERKELKVTY